METLQMKNSTEESWQKTQKSSKKTQDISTTKLTPENSTYVVLLYFLNSKILFVLFFKDLDEQLMDEQLAHELDNTAQRMEQGFFLLFISKNILIFCLKMREEWSAMNTAENL